MDYRISQQGIGSATSTGIATTAESASPVRDCISGTEQLLSDMHTAIDMVEKRLDTLLTPCAPAPQAQPGSNKPTPATSHVYGRLTILNEGFQHAILRLHDLNRRIEL